MAEGSSPACLQVALEGSVIWISPDHDQFILQDDTGGVRLTADSARNLRLGCRATVKGGCFLYAKGIYTQPLLEDDGIHAPVEKSARIRLLAGSYPLKIEFFNALGPFELKIDIAGPGLPRQPLPKEMLFHLDSTAPGLACDYYEGAWQTLPDFSALRPLRRGVVARPSLDLRARDTNFGVVFAGFLKTREAGEYTFWLSSDDGSRLLLGAPLKITMLDTAPFPPPLLLPQDRPPANPITCRWAEAAGTVVRVYEDTRGAGCELAAGNSRILVQAPAAMRAAMRALLHRSVHVYGVGESIRTLDALPAWSILISSPADLRVTAPNPAPGSELPPPAPAGVVSNISTPAAPLTQAIEVKRLSRSDAERGLPVLLKGVVTAKTGPNFVIQDATWSVFCYWTDSGLTETPEIGESWEVEGRSSVHFAPDVEAARVRYLGPAALPEPVRPTKVELINGALDTQFIELRGVVMSAGSNHVSLLTGEGIIQCYGLNLKSSDEIEGAVARVRGVCIPDRDINQRVSGRASPLQLFNAALFIDEPPPSDPFQVPSRRVSDLLVFDAQANALRRVKIAAQFLEKRGDVYFALDQTNGLRFETRDNLGLQRGDLIEVVGFPDIAQPSPVLREARARVTGRSPLPPPRLLSGDQMLNPHLDATLVSAVGTLLEAKSTPARQLLTLQSGAVTFSAVAPVADGAAESISPGSKVQVSGVYAAEGGVPAPGQAAGSFAILVASPADVRELERPSWWTLQHSLAAMAVMAAAVIAALVWVGLLRRQVEERTQRLADEMKGRQRAESQRALESERRRIAQDLHDEIGATLTEIRFLGAVKSRDATVPESTRLQLREISEKSNQMVSSLDEIVWAVNPSNDSLPNLANYLCHLAEEFFVTANMRFRLDLDQALPQVILTSEVRHNLYLVVREALNNVMKHSHAAEARLRIHCRGDALEIAVEDDGRGFNAQDVTLRKRNGLSNMQARLAKIGGVFECQSQPGQGTVCRIRLPLPLPPA